MVNTVSFRKVVKFGLYCQRHIAMHLCQVLMTLAGSRTSTYHIENKMTSKWPLVPYSWYLGYPE